MDIETALRTHLSLAGDGQRIITWANNEGRMMLTVSNPDGVEHEFVAVEDKLIPWPVKPPPQRLGVEGFDSHQGMGGTK